MLKKHQNLVLNFLGVILILLGIAAIFNAFYYEGLERYYAVFWMCYTSLIIIGFGMLFKKGDLIKSQIYILAIADLFWIVDFFSIILLKKSLFGITEYFFYPGPLLPKIVTLQHLIVIPIAIYALSFLKFKRENGWKLSLLQLTAFYIVTKTLTPTSLNINCVHRACGTLLGDLGKFYPLAWFLSAFAIVFITRFIFIKLYEKLDKKRVRK